MNSQSKPTSSARPPEQTSARPSVDSQTLLRGASAIEIEHSGQRYLLRVTRENKLILTK